MYGVGQSRLMWFLRTRYSGDMGEICGDIGLWFLRTRAAAAAHPTRNPTLALTRTRAPAPTPTPTLPLPRPRLLRMFAMLWGTADLISSFEGFSMFPPAAQVVRVGVRVRDGPAQSANPSPDPNPDPDPNPSPYPNL